MYDDGERSTSATLSPPSANDRAGRCPCPGPVGEAEDVAVVGETTPMTSDGESKAGEPRADETVVGTRGKDMEPDDEGVPAVSASLGAAAAAAAADAVSSGVMCVAAEVALVLGGSDAETEAWPLPCTP
jgi:hypothetical protein